LRVDTAISTFIDKRLYVGGDKLDLKDYDAFRLPYDIDERDVMITAGRQVGKTVYLAAKLATRSVFKHPSRALYVSPLESQAKTFSKTKLKPIIDSTKELKAAFRGKDTQDDVFFKRNSLGGYIELTYASITGSDPVRVRGKSADDLYLDEAQDIVYDIIPVIKEVTTSSKDPTVTYAGTAKSLENTTGVIWELSNKLERVIKCTHCGHWNIINRDNISKAGLVCNKPSCRKRIYVENAQWVITGDPHAEYVGFRIPQPVLPFHNQESKWSEVWKKYVTTSPETFNQEVLGIPSGAADRFLTLDMLKELCTNKNFVYAPTTEWRKNYHSLFMGIDWTGDGVLNKSRTVAVIIGHRRDGRFELVWAQIFPPGNTNHQAEELIKIATLFQCQIVGADAGMGMVQNADMMAALGANRFRQILYSGAKKPFDYDINANRIILNRTAAIDTIMMMFAKKFRPQAITGGKIMEFLFPTFNESRPFFEDILAEFTQETSTGYKIWTHANTKPDDTLHAIVFGMYAYMHFRGFPTFYWVGFFSKFLIILDKRFIGENIMPSKKEVVTALREAAAEIGNLKNENAALAEKNKTLMEKIASLEEKTTQVGNEFSPNEIEHDSALQKKAEQDGFQFRSSGFGQTADIPGVDDYSHLSPDERMDLILSGESVIEY